MDTFDSKLGRTGFGTSGVRALVADLSPDIVAAYTLAYADWLLGQGLAKPDARVILGHDLRPSSPHIARTVMAALRERRLEPVYCGALATPAIANHALREGNAAIIVTGSHIPFDRNGIKFYRPEGEILKADEAAILANLAAVKDEALAGLAGAPLPAAEPAASQSYIRRYDCFFPETFLRNTRIGLFQHSSVARDLLRSILEGFGAAVIPIARSDTFVAVDTEAVVDADQAQAFDWAREHGFDALVSTDGDGDRPLIGDETGRYFRGDAVGILTARHLGARSVVTPVNANTALEKSGWFAHVERTKIGSPFVIDAMTALSADPAASPVVGFEANGGFLTATPIERNGATLDPLPTRDSLLPMLCLLEAALNAGKPMSSLHSVLPARATASVRLQGIDTAKARAFIGGLADTQNAAAFLGGLELAHETTDLTDGVRMMAVSGEIVHLRMSGNAPELRCYAETAGQVASDTLAARALDVVKKEVG
jgi:phosphomannomutase